MRAQWQEIPKSYSVTGNFPGIEAVQNASILPVSSRQESSTLPALNRYLSGTLPVFFLHHVSSFYRKNSSGPDRTENAFYQIGLLFSQHVAPRLNFIHPTNYISLNLFYWSIIIIIIIIIIQLMYFRTITSDPAAWFISQFLTYLLRPRYETEKLLEARKDELHFRTPIVG